MDTITGDLNETAPAKVQAKGDLVAGTATNAIARVAVGNDGEVLHVNSSASTGVAWQAGGASNLLVNGGMEIWQRGTSFAAMNDVQFGPDGWYYSKGGTSALTITQEPTTIDSYSRYSAALAYTHNAASAVQQKIEDFYQLRGRTLTVTARIRTSTASAAKVTLYDGTTATASSFHTGGGTFETLSVSATMSASATQVLVQINLAASATVYVDNVMLTIGSAPIAYRPLTAAEEINRCQRYYEVHGGTNASMVVRDSANGAEAYGQTIMFHVQKGGAPTVALAGTWATTNSGAPGVNSPDSHSYDLNAVASGAGAANFFANSTDDVITARYELI